ncbi:MAG: hypothetical protein K0R75_3362, partial [Paenibacillaceae bacterium]|nr:hypothetical protein [Paenibacillaceae bacterium]
NLDSSIVTQYDSYFQNGTLGWFDTSAEIEPRSGGFSKYDLFTQYTLPGKTVGYREPWADAWGLHGTIVDSRWDTPPQWNYWRLLSDLSLGISYVAVYGNDLDVMENNHRKDENGNSINLPATIPGTTTDNYQDEFRDAIHFAAKYAGYHNSPGSAPGGWVAFRVSKSDPNYTDYTFLMSLLNPSVTTGMDARDDGTAVPTGSGYTHLTIPGQYSIGPYYQRCGSWARKLLGGKTMQLQMRDSLVDTINRSSTKKINVTYYDQDNSGTITLQVNYGGTKSFTIDVKDTKKWITKTIDASNATFVDDADGANVTLKSIGGPTILHMVEVTK